MTEDSWHKLKSFQYVLNLIGLLRGLPKRIVVFFKNFRWNKQYILLSVSVLLVLISLGVITHVLLPKGKLGGDYYQSIEGFSVLLNNETPASIAVGLHPVAQMGTVAVSIFIENWVDVQEDCEVIQINFPGLTCCHKYKVPLVLEPPITEEDFVTGRYSGQYLNYPEMTLLRETEPETRRDVIMIFPKEIEDFCGMIEFFWDDGIVRTTFTEYAISIPFLSTGGFIEGMTKANDYTFIVWSPKRYAISSSIPEPINMHMFGKMFYYIFELGSLGSESDLIIYFEDNNLARIENYIIVVFSTLLGVSLAVLVQQLSRL